MLRDGLYIYLSRKLWPANLRAFERASLSLLGDRPNFVTAYNYDLREVRAERVPALYLVIVRELLRRAHVISRKRTEAS